MEEVIQMLLKHSKWCFKDEEGAELFIREKLLDNNSGWYRKLGLNTLKRHLQKWGWVLKEKNINLILANSEADYTFTKKKMQEQKTWADYKGKDSMWSDCVMEVTPQLFASADLPEAKGPHGNFYWIVVSLVGRIQKGRRAEKIKDQPPVLAEEVREQIEPILYPLFYKSFFGSGQSRRFVDFMARFNKESRGSVNAIKRHAEFIHEFVQDKDLKSILDEINIKKNMDMSESYYWTDVAEKVLRKHGWERRSDGVKLTMILDLLLQKNLIIGDYYPNPEGKRVA